mgnify:FL=1
MAGPTIKVGNVEMIALTDTASTRDPVATFPSSTLDEWRHVPGVLNDEDQISSRVGTTGIRSGGKLIIVDTGLQLPGARLLDDMKAKGVDREAVDIVFLTHLHGDHVGWNMSDGKPTFPNARYIIPRHEYEHWTDEDFKKNWPHIDVQVTPLANLDILDLVDDGYNITDEVSTMETPGHTAGHTSLVISSGGEKGFVLGDVCNNPVQAHFTDWCPVFDMDPAKARQTRHAVVDRLEAEGTLVSAGHFPDPGFGHFVRAQGKRLWRGV